MKRQSVRLHTIRRLAFFGLLSLTAMTACGSSSASDDPDVMFAQMMIPHHEQAIELADLALNPAAEASDAIRDLAAQIKSAQDPEIAFMKNWLTERDQPLNADSSVDHSSMMKGMLTLEELDNLRALAGSEFNQKWIASMIAHHEGAIDMARTVLKDGKDAEISALARAITESQGAEIELLKTFKEKNPL